MEELRSQTVASEATRTMAKGRGVLPETAGRGHQEEDRVVVPGERGKTGR